MFLFFSSHPPLRRFSETFIIINQARNLKHVILYTSIACRLIRNAKMFWQKTTQIVTTCIYTVDVAHRHGHWHLDIQKHPCSRTERLRGLQPNQPPTPSPRGVWRRQERTAQIRRGNWPVILTEFQVRGGPTWIREWKFPQERSVLLPYFTDVCPSFRDVWRLARWTNICRELAGETISRLVKSCVAVVQPYATGS